MADDQIQIFVSALVDHLNYVFTNQGSPKPRIWWDQRQIDKADRFDPMLQAAIEGSSLLLVVMSRNWLSRPWCRKELELFAKRPNAHEHIVLVRRNHVAPSEHPEELQNIQGYDFFSLDDWREPGNERLFFDRGEPQDRDMFLKLVDELGSILWRRAKNHPRRNGGVVTDTKTIAPEVKAPGRTIYLAKPASDMMKAYDRVATELVRQKYTVVPPIGEKIPADASALALAFVDNALAAAELSIHLLGEKPGYAPDELDPIVRLQLTRAAERAKSPGPGGALSRPFSRIVWAPKILEEGFDPSAADFREPVAVLEKFDSYRAGDKVVGDVSNAFLTYLKRELDLRDPSGIVDGVSPENQDSRIYVWHRKDDREFARKVHKWLRAQKADAVLPGNDDDADRDKLHRKNLAECDAVFLCWAQATDVWAKMSASELRSWRDMGRKNKFTVRGLVLGPPPGESKSEDDMPLIPQEVDEILDLSQDEQLMLDRLQPLLDRSRSSHP
jgi:hypothetical protein